MFSLLRFLLLCSLLSFSQSENLFDENSQDQLSDPNLLDSLSLFSSLFGDFSPFSIFGVALDPEDNSESVDGTEGTISFWSFSTPSFVMFFWSGSPDSEDNLEDLAEIDTDPSKKASDVELSCTICEWLMENVNVMIFTDGISQFQFDAALRKGCFELGFTHTYCDSLIYEVVPQMIQWIAEGNDPSQFCACTDDDDYYGYYGGTTSDCSSTGEYVNEDSDDKYSTLLRSVVVVLLSGLVFGMIFLTVRVFQYARLRNSQGVPHVLLENEEEISAPPAYSDLTDESGQPPKYAFSAQDAALLEMTTISPPEYSVNVEESSSTSPSSPSSPSI